jgi:hypothetical protein
VLKDYRSRATIKGIIGELFPQEPAPLAVAEPGASTAP